MEKRLLEIYRRIAAEEIKLNKISKSKPKEYHFQAGLVDGLKLARDLIEGYGE